MNTLTRTILLNFQNNSIGILYFVLDDYHGFSQDDTDDNIQTCIDKSVYQNPVINWRRIEPNEIPEDRYFRDAWEDHNGIEVNMNKAREIHKDYLRKLRKPKLETLDIDY